LRRMGPQHQKHTGSKDFGPFEGKLRHGSKRGSVVLFKEVGQKHTEGGNKETTGNAKGAAVGPPGNSNPSAWEWVTGDKHCNTLSKPRKENRGLQYYVALGGDGGRVLRRHQEEETSQGAVAKEGGQKQRQGLDGIQGRAGKVQKKGQTGHTGETGARNKKQKKKGKRVRT